MLSSEMLCKTGKNAKGSFMHCIKYHRSSHVNNIKKEDDQGRSQSELNCQAKKA